jgi:hypothetical protein
MASINTTIVLFSANLGPGQTYTFWWNNPNINAIYAFSAVTHSNFSSPNADLKVEISPLRYNYNVGTQKRRLEFGVKNLTQEPLSFELHMSWAA